MSSMFQEKKNNENNITHMSVDVVFIFMVFVTVDQYYYTPSKLCLWGI